MLKNKEVHHEHDVGYKHIFSHKATFLKFLRRVLSKFKNPKNIYITSKEHLKNIDGVGEVI